MRIVINVKEIEGGKITVTTRADPSARDTQREDAAGHSLCGYISQMLADMEAAAQLPVKVSRWARVKAFFAGKRGRGK